MDERLKRAQIAPREEADRLWSGAQEAFEGAERSFVSLSEALNLGIRAAEIYSGIRLQPARDRYPATIMTLLEESAPEVNIQRDAIYVPKSLQFLDVLDMLSAEDLPCVSPKLHRGWEDPRFACLRVRRTSHEAIPTTIGEASRQKLLLLLACRNRIFRLPPPVAIPTEGILRAFPTLETLVQNLATVDVP